jgi:hypothetical protein
MIVAHLWGGSKDGEVMAYNVTTPPYVLQYAMMLSLPAWPVNPDEGVIPLSTHIETYHLASNYLTVEGNEYEYRYHT